MAAEREARLINAQASSSPGSTTPVKGAGARAWLHASWKDLKQNWVLLIYMVILMTGFNSCSHGSQDLYPTFLKTRTLPHPPPTYPPHI